MKRKCARTWCSHLTIEDGRECPEHTNETLRETRPAIVPEWVRRAREDAEQHGRVAVKAIA